MTEEEREKRLAEKMPKHKPPEGPVSIGEGNNGEGERLSMDVTEVGSFTLPIEITV